MCDASRLGSARRRIRRRFGGFVYVVARPDYGVKDRTWRLVAQAFWRPHRARLPARQGAGSVAKVFGVAAAPGQPEVGVRELRGARRSGQVCAQGVAAGAGGLPRCGLHVLLGDLDDAQVAIDSVRRVCTRK